jgi:hypothetical protein
VKPVLINDMPLEGNAIEALDTIWPSFIYLQYTRFSVDEPLYQLKGMEESV